MFKMIKSVFKNIFILAVFCAFIIASLAFSMQQVIAEENSKGATNDWESAKQLIGQKNILGLHGEQLICYEYAPVGYAIYDYSGELWERCEFAPSPYINSDSSNLIYGGPKQYYKINYNNKKITNLHDNKSKDISEKFYNKLESIKKSALETQYNKAMPRGGFDGGIIKQGSVGGVLASVDTTNANTTGTCGGVAAALVLHYYDQKFPEKNINSNDSFSSLLKKLEDEGDLSSSTADTIKPVVKKYLANHGGDCFKHHTLLGLFTTNAVLTSCIDKKNPVMLFAAVEDPSKAGSQSIAHAFVAHTYHVRLGAMNTRKYSYVCHFGWGSKYNYVEVHNAVKYMTIGTSYSLEII